MTVNPFALEQPPAPVPAAALPTQPATPPPAGNPFGAPGAAPAPAQTIPYSVTATVTPGEDPFSGPAPQAPRGPRLRDIYGRLLLVIPHKVEEGLPNRLQPGTTQDRMTADVIILDGGPVHYGGKPEATPPTPHDKTAAVPHRTQRMFISSVGLISQCRDALAKRRAGQPGMVLGRLGVGEVKEAGQSPPYLLAPPTEEDKQVARAYLATVDPFA